MLNTPETWRIRAKFDPDHSVFQAPADDAAIWRYIDFTKLVAMLDAHALFLARADTFDDRFEGSLTEGTAEDRARWVDTLDVTDEKKREMLEGWIKHTQRSVEETFVNCWNLSEDESAALWGLYVSPASGVAIKTTYRRLIESVSLPSESEERQAEVTSSSVPQLYVGRVHYLDYRSQRFDVGNGLYPFVHKRRSFEHEHELRAVIRLFEVPPDEQPPLGLELEVNLPTLIERIYVSPAAPAWFVRLVESVIRKYDCAAPVQQSSLDAEPLF